MVKNQKVLLKTLIAVAVNDKNINKTAKKQFQICSEENNIYFLMPEKMEAWDLPNLASNLRKWFKVQKEGINVDLDSFANFANENLTQFDIIQTILWWVRFFEKDPYTQKTKDIIILDHNIIYKKVSEKIIEEISTIIEAQEFCRRLQDTPSNQLNALDFVKEVEDLFKPFASKVKITILDKKELTKKGMGLLLGVNAGSIVEPRLISIEYRGNPDSKELIGYVGKGIIFDTGGANLKTGPNMRWMKFDMSGAAIMMSTLFSLVKNNVKTNVVAIGAITDNILSATSIKPDDILKSYNGMTVEIDNTDAEGRLVLADALTYAVRDMKVTKLVDIATLTGAMIFSLGDSFSGTWVTDENEWSKFRNAANKAGESIWRLPFHDDFLAMLKSPIADIKNSCSDRRGGSSRAAGFLKEFTNNLSYIHLDVAITADIDNRGQAVMIRTLYQYATAK